MKAFYINTCGEIHSSESCFFYKKWLMKLSSLFCFAFLLPALSYAQVASNYYLDVYDNSGKRIN